MDAEQIRGLRPMLARFLKRFDDCFARKDTRAHLWVYVKGQLSSLERKSVEPIALAASVPVRTLQEFLSQHRWEEDRARDRLQQIVAEEHAHPHSVGILDETSFVKQGDKTPGVQRQYLGTVGKQGNGIVTVHLAYAADDFHCLLDGELFLPESWAQDPGRCREAKIPETMTYRPKTKVALELYDRARGNGIRFDWLTFDEWYGGKPEFLRALEGRNQRFVGEVPRCFMGWINPPPVTQRPWRHRRGRGRKVPRIVAGGRPAQSVEHLFWWHPALKHQDWQRWRVKDGEKGPMVWEVKHVPFSMQGPDGLPGGRWHLVVARNVLDPTEMKFFVSNASPDTSVGAILLAGFSRWRVERCFEDGKGEVGLDHYEGRRYPGLKRHLILSAISYLFLARTNKRLRGGKIRIDRMPSAYRGVGADPLVVARPTSLGATARPHRRRDPASATTQRLSFPLPHQANSAKTAETRHQTDPHAQVQVEHELAL
jgi:SRSO17 transposase